MLFDSYLSSEQFQTFVLRLSLTISYPIQVFPIRILALLSRWSISLDLVYRHDPNLWVIQPSISILGPVNDNDFLVLIPQVWKQGTRRVEILNWRILEVNEINRFWRSLTIFRYSSLITVIFGGRDKVAAVKLLWYRSPDLTEIDPIESLKGLGPTTQNNLPWLGGSKLHSKLWLLICNISCFVVK